MFEDDPYLKYEIWKKQKQKRLNYVDVYKKKCVYGVKMCIQKEHYDDKLRRRKKRKRRGKGTGTTSTTNRSRLGVGDS